MQRRWQAIAHALMGRGSACRAQLDIFAELACEQTLHEFPLLYHILHMYAMIRVVCRSVGGDHSEFKQVSDINAVSSFTWKCNAARRLDIESALDENKEFEQFLCRHRRQRNFWRRSATCLGISGLSTMQHKDVLGHWYQCSTRNQFRSMIRAERMLVLFRVLVKPLLSPAVVFLTDAVLQVARLVKSKMAQDYIQIWACRRSILTAGARDFAIDTMMLYCDFGRLCDGSSSSCSSCSGSSNTGSGSSSSSGGGNKTSTSANNSNISSSRRCAGRTANHGGHRPFSVHVLQGVGGLH